MEIKNLSGVAIGSALHYGCIDLNDLKPSLSEAEDK
jgi:hypothetical protein